MINLLPKEEKDLLVKMRLIRFVTLSSTFLFYTGIIASIALLPSYVLSVSKEKDIVILYEKLQLEESTKESNSLNVVVGDINQKLSLLPGDDPKRFSETFFEPIISRKGGAVSITSISYSKNTEGAFVGRISGVASTRSGLLLFVDELKKIPDFSEVSVPISNLVKDRDIAFSLDFILP